MIEHNNKEYVCKLDLASDILRGKWKTVLLCHIAKGPKRFLELQHTTGSISQKVLNEKLVELEKEGLIQKTIFPEVPPRVEFTLTPKGMDLALVIDQLEEWSHKYY